MGKKTVDKEYNVIISQSAWNDLDRIHEYYCHQSVDIQVADKIRDKIVCTIHGLSFMPYTRPLVISRFEGDYRKAICGQFVIPFKIYEKTKTVFVTRIFHGAMNFAPYL